MEQTESLIIGGGPAGLMAAEVLSAAGHRVIVAEAKPTLGRKFLMAGKSGLNLTKAEPWPVFLAQYGEAAQKLRPMLDRFRPADVQTWAEALGQETFTGSTGRVFPVAMKASPLLRAWIGRLVDAGADIRTGWRWTGWQDDACTFETPDGPKQVQAKTVLFALGGASWPRLGSDGLWAKDFKSAGIPLAPFQPANAGLRVAWSDHMKPLFGTPLKNIALHAGETTSRGECVISAKGLEGGGIYSLSRPLRNDAVLTIDLLPDRDAGWIASRLRRGGKQSISNRLRRDLKLDPGRIALLMEFARPLPAADDLAQLIKSLPIPHQGLRPLAEAISSSGGVRWDALDDGLMLKDKPGSFIAGEMLDWEAPTGGYLLTACFATGRWAGQAMADRLSKD